MIFRPQFDIQYFNGTYILVMNPQMARILMEEIKKQGNNLNCVVSLQLPFTLASGLKELCEKSPDWNLRSLGTELNKLFDEYNQRRTLYQERKATAERQPSIASDDEGEDELEEEPIDTPTYGQARRRGK
jgi:hypothetical protein